MKTKRTVYLETIDLEEAKHQFKEHFSELYKSQNETIEAHKSLGRITSSPIYARLSNPHYNASAMDGIALNAAVTYGAHERNPVVLKEHLDFVYVDTGDLIPEHCNAVVMIEDVYPNDDGTVHIMRSAYPWEHVRVIGEDIAIGDMVLPSNHRIKAVDIGAILSAGLTTIDVRKQMKIGIIPTGSEIVSPGSDLKPGNIIDSNSYVFESMVLEAGGTPRRYDPVPDDRELLKQALLKAVEENDMVVINAGSSAGSEDYSADLIRELGSVYVHGIAIKPGKPTILGNIQGKAVIGIPGYPVSAYIAFRNFVIPFVHGTEVETGKELAEVILSKRIVSALKHKEFVRMKLGQVGDKLIGTPLARGAGVTMSLVKADGLLEIPKNVEGYEAGTKANVELIRPKETIVKAMVSIGSHDIIMDEINNLMKKQEDGYHLSSAHVGSLGGIMAIRRGETHIAPIHLLDEDSGQYNQSFIHKYLKNQDVLLIKGIKRWQGIYVQKGNPLAIKNLKDIAEADILFANRQKGSGTRTLLDYQLKMAGIDSSELIGYDHEFTTHTSVALAVKSGNSQTGLGIESVARKMELDFIPVALEDYDFILPKQYEETPVVQAFLKILESDTFKKKLEALGGYVYKGLEFIEIKQ